MPRAQSPDRFDLYLQLPTNELELSSPPEETRSALPIQLRLLEPGAEYEDSSNNTAQR